MKQTTLMVYKNNPIIGGVYKLLLTGDVSAIERPGQFVELAVPGYFLRRPFSVCDWDRDTVTVVYRTIGGGTKRLAAMMPGEGVNALTGLGNGFDTSVSGDRPLLIAGGSGVPMMLYLAKKLLAEGKTVTAVLGYRTALDIFLADDLRYLGVDVRLTTEDGSAGVRGMVTDAMTDLDYTYFYTCGPEAMFRAVNAAAKTSGQFSLEARMGCGYGACMGCTIETKNGPKRVCKDGPVFTREDLLW